MLRYEELPLVQKTFNLFYTNRLQLVGQRMDAQRQMRKAMEVQRQIEEAKPIVSSKTEEFAARYRAKQLGKGDAAQSRQP